MKINQLLEDREQLDELDWGKAWNGVKKVAGGVKDAAVGTIRGVGDVASAAAGGVTQTVGAAGGGYGRGYHQAR